MDSYYALSPTEKIVKCYKGCSLCAQIADLEKVVYLLNLKDSKRQLIEALKDTQRTLTSVSEIWGKWPGNETVEELLESLKDSVECVGKSK